MGPLRLSAISCRFLYAVPGTSHRCCQYPGLRSTEDKRPRKPLAGLRKLIVLNIVHERTADNFSAESDKKLRHSENPFDGKKHRENEIRHSLPITSINSGTNCEPVQITFVPGPIHVRYTAARLYDPNASNVIMMSGIGYLHQTRFVRIYASTLLRAD